MTTLKAKAVLFDIGNVLVDWHPRHAYRDYFHNNPERLDYFLTHIWSMEWHSQLDKGISFAKGIHNLCWQHPAWHDAITAYDQLWDQMFSHVIDGSVELLADLSKQGVPLYALTNFPAEKFPAFVEKYAFMQYFEDRVVVSGQEGLIKPDPALFQCLMDRYNLKAPDLIFIDDRLDNVQAAQKLGMDGIHFQNPDQTRSTLIDRQVLSITSLQK
ncbi:MAG: hypothetical protein CMF31_03305 [Kordiimonas sp.]|nr:hypothetical protein [Kordiimonas sp.]|tara:strand:- start:410 stop:1051 length:642 start_codon:yes stop_codon:yes gene_type:complete